jgi:thymidine phosphorylase
MAVFFRGMTLDERVALTRAMTGSGATIDWREAKLSGPILDKHSTGGVGDKVSLILAPLVASCGAAVPQLSGRGLGHTGGTLDKLESIPGWRAALPADEMVAVLNSAGCVICAAGPGLAPADRRLYALRDVTGTVESIPLIASSIMSKKIAEGTAALVLDVKVGSGAFMRDISSARKLAQTMVGLGAKAGVATTALLTRMDVPLGRAVGKMLALAGVRADPAVALADGRALARYRDMIMAQGGDPDADLPRARHAELVTADQAGWLQRLDAYAVGVAAWRLGAGRARKEDPVSAAAGVLCLAKPGEPVEAGQPVLELRSDDPARLARAREALSGAIEIGSDPPAAGPLVIERITA